MICPRLSECFSEAKALNRKELILDTGSQRVVLAGKDVKRADHLQLL